MARRLTRRQHERINQHQETHRRSLGRPSSRRDPNFDENSLGQPQTGLVVANYGQALVIEDHQGDLYHCAVRQNLGAIACGDRVIWQALEDNKGIVVAVQPRRSLLCRPDYSGRVKPVAANLDQIAIVVAPRPEFNEFLIDRYLVAIAGMGSEPLIVVNKIDLLDSQARTALEERLSTYRHIGCTVLFASSRSARGLDALGDRLGGCLSILVGQSGVGKSSLVQALLPNRDIRIQALSQATGLGTHTTTTATLYHLPQGGDLIDSPGVRSFELGDLQAEDVDRGFIEFISYLGHCRFSNCSHTVEPGCALKEAVKCGEIDPRRLASYHQLKAAVSGR